MHATHSDPQKPQRQRTYWRALSTLPGVSLHQGQFLSHVKSLPLAHRAPHGPETVQVIRTDEKGSDVNLASYLLVDGFDADYEVAIVISNDSDLATPIRMVRERLGLPVGVLNPVLDGKASWQLRNTATFYRKVRESALAACQFPDTLCDLVGMFYKPAGW